jgi:hypothetical protein
MQKTKAPVSSNWALHADANMGHRFAIFMAHVGTLRPIGLRRR